MIITWANIGAPCLIWKYAGLLGSKRGIGTREWPQIKLARSRRILLGSSMFCFTWDILCAFSGTWSASPDRTALFLSIHHNRINGDTAYFSQCRLHKLPMRKVVTFRAGKEPGVNQKCGLSWFGHLHTHVSLRDAQDKSRRRVSIVNALKTD